MAQSDQNGYPLDLVKIAIEVERPTTNELKDLSRGEKYTHLLKNTVDRRTHLIQWLREKKLLDQVHGIGEATAFNLLYMAATKGVAAQIQYAPGVVRVSNINEIKVDLLKVE